MGGASLSALNPSCNSVLRTLFSRLPGFFARIVYSNICGLLRAQTGDLGDYIISKKKRLWGAKLSHLSSVLRVRGPLTNQNCCVFGGFRTFCASPTIIYLQKPTCAQDFNYHTLVGQLVYVLR